jgi:hypothetical protein
VPAGIGIEIRDPGVRHGRGPSYGGISLCKKPCISPLHTHQADGVIHTEAPKRQTFRLGKFFAEWDVRLTSACVGGYCAPAAPIAVFVDGKRRTGNPSRIVLDDGEEIAIVIGTPPKEIPSKVPLS